MLKNPSFTIWPRGEVSNPASGTELAASWFISHGDGGVGGSKLSRVDAPVSGHAIRIEAQGGAGQGWFGLLQHIPNAGSCSGRWVEVSFMARASHPMIVGIEFTQVFQADPYRKLPWQNIPIGTSWERAAIRTFVDSVDGMVMEASSTLDMFVGLPTAGQYWVELSRFAIAEV